MYKLETISWIHYRSLYKKLQRVEIFLNRVNEPSNTYGQVKQVNKRIFIITYV